jgi:hypothetical protein
LNENQQNFIKDLDTHISAGINDDGEELGKI